MPRFAYTLRTFWVKVACTFNGLFLSHGFWGLSFAACDNAVTPIKCKQSQPENLVIYLSVVDALLLFYLGLTLSSVRHCSLLMFDSSFISLMVLSWILTLFCHLFASSSFFFLASSSWEILEVSSASSVACTHTRTQMGRELRVLLI